MKTADYRKLSNIFNQNRGLSNYAFSLFSFVQRLYEECIKDEITDIYFLSREGKFLKKLYDAYENLAQKDTKIHTHYMYISRKAVVNATLDEIEKETFTFLNGYQEISLEKFLQCLNFNEEEYLCIQGDREKTFSNLSNLLNSTEFNLLKQNPDFLKFYNEKRLTAKSNLKKYLVHIGYTNAPKAAIVDVGWNGTIQNGLYKLNLHKELCGYYIGIFSKCSEKYNRKKGLLFDEVMMSDPFCYRRYYYEYICIANHGATEAYDENGKPVLEPDYDMKLYDNYYKKIQTDIMMKFQKILSVVNENQLKEKEVRYFVKHKHAQMLLRLSVKDKEIIRNSIENHPDNFINITFKRTLKYYIYIVLQRMAISYSFVKYGIQSLTKEY